MQDIFLGPRDVRWELLSGEDIRREVSHGPLAVGEEVRTHAHGQPHAYRVIAGSACYCGESVTKILGAGLSADTVVVDANRLHGWKAVVDGTLIQQISGEAAVSKLLATAAL